MLGNCMHLSMRFACDRGHENAGRRGALRHVIVIAFHGEKAECFKSDLKAATKVSPKDKSSARQTAGGPEAGNERAAAEETMKETKELQQGSRVDECSGAEEPAGDMN